MRKSWIWQLLVIGTAAIAGGIILGISGCMVLEWLAGVLRRWAGN